MDYVRSSLAITVVVVLVVSLVAVNDLLDGPSASNGSTVTLDVSSPEALARARDRQHPGQGRGPRHIPAPFRTSPTEAPSAESTSTTLASTTSSTSRQTASTEAPSTTQGPAGTSGGTITGNACPCMVTGSVELKGEVSLNGDITVMGGTLIARPGVHVDGNGFEIMVMDGGRVDFQGTPKSGWVEWGQNPSGWNSGDRLAIAPLAKGDFNVHYDTWNGSWSGVSPSKTTLSNGQEVRAEVANLTRDVVFENLARIMFHHGADKQTLRHIAVVDSGVTGELGFYPIHFHLSKSTTAGSLIEGVVVEGGKNHAFVPHGVNDVTFKDVVAVDTIDNAYWWDPPTSNDATNNSDRVVWSHALALGVTPIPGDRGIRLSAFTMGAGVSNSCVDCHAAAVQGDKDASGFVWGEFVGGSVPQEGVWSFHQAVSHNNRANGIFVWQNVSRPHKIEDTLIFRNGRSGIKHGAYVNTYTYENIDSLENGRYGVHNLAFGRDCDENPANLVTFRDIRSDGLLLVGEHNLDGFGCPAEYYDLRVLGVEVDEGDREAGISRFYDSNLSRDDFTMTNPRPGSIFEIYEGGQLVDRWENGTWSSG